MASIIIAWYCHVTDINLSHKHVKWSRKYITSVSIFKRENNKLHCIKLTVDVRGLEEQMEKVI